MLNLLQRAFWRGIITAAMFPFVNIEVEGKENLPQEGEMPLIVICNHFSYWDPLIMMSRIPRRARFLAAVEMTRIFFFSHPAQTPCGKSHPMHSDHDGILSRPLQN